MISISSDWILMKYTPLDSSQCEDSNGSKIIVIGSVLMKLVYFKVLYYLIIILLFKVMVFIYNAFIK